MRRALFRIVVGTGAFAVGTLVSAGVASAHTPGFSLSCEGARLTGSGYEDGDTNVGTIEIDGVAVFHIDDFGTTLDHTEPVPQDGVVHSVHFVLDAQGPATEDHPEYDLDVTQNVGPCGEVTTTTPESSTTSPGSSTTSPGSSTTSPGSSTTSPESSTTTTLPGISIAAFSPVCLRDAPYVDVTFGDQSQFNGRMATVTFIDLDGKVVETHTTTFQAGATRRFVYPGAEVDANGNPIDWPGWLFDGDEWVIDPSDARLRDGLRVVVEVNPTATGTVGYPPATPDCDASPPGPPNTPPTGTLPTTGQDSSSTVLVATAVLIGGVALFAVARLRIAKK